jgi:zinc protease
MMRKIYFYILLFFSIVASNAANLDPEVVHGVLPCGLTYYVLSNNRPAGDVSMYLVQSSGSLIETAETRGYSHFIEHLAFRGTKNYPDGAIDKYLSDNGLKFGSEYNASTNPLYTQFEIKSISNSDETLQAKCMDILHDISCNVTFDDATIDSERKVIQEEARSNRSALSRADDALRNQVLPQGNLYRDVTTIGLKETLQEANSTSLSSFYRKWYSFKHQAIVVVGDISTKQILDLIKKTWAKDAKAIPENILPSDAVPVFQSPKAAVCYDKELTDNDVTVIYPQKTFTYDELSSRDYQVDYYVNTYIAALLQNRLTQLAADAEGVVYGPYAGCDSYLLCPYRQTISVTLPYVQNEKARALEMLANEIKRMKLYGATEAELDVLRTKCRRTLDTYQSNRNEMTHGDLAEALVQHFITGESMPAIDSEGFKTEMNQVLGLMTMETLNDRITSAFSDSDFVIALTEKEDASTQKITSEQLLEMYEQAYRDATPSATIDGGDAFDLEAYSPVPGKILSSTQSPDFSDYDARDFVLSNGMTVKAVKVDVMEDEIMLNAVRAGGKSLIYDHNPLGADVATDIWQLDGIGKITRSQLDQMTFANRVFLASNVDEYELSVMAACRNAELEKMFKIVNQAFNPVNRNKSRYEAWKRQQTGRLRQAADLPDFVVMDSLNHEVFGANHPYRHMVHAEDVEGVDYEKTCDDIDAQLSEVNHFTVIITGTFDYDELIPLIEKYIASIPAGASTTPATDELPELDDQWLPTHRSIRFNMLMAEPRAHVYRAYQAPLGHDLVFDMGFKMLADVLNDRYVAILRANEGGTYVVNVSTECPSAIDYARFEISFESNHEQAEMLSQRAHDELVDIAQNGLTDEEYSKVMSYYLDYYSRVKLQPEYPMLALTWEAVHQSRDVFTLLDAVFQVDQKLLQQLAQILVNAPSQPNIIVGATNEE